MYSSCTWRCPPTTENPHIYCRSSDPVVGMIIGPLATVLQSATGTTWRAGGGLAATLFARPIHIAAIEPFTDLTTTHEHLTWGVR